MQRDNPTPRAMAFPTEMEELDAKVEEVAALELFLSRLNRTTTLT